MTRYVIQVGSDSWITAVYEQDSNGIGLTRSIADAGSWVTIERAAAVARVVADRLGCSPAIAAITEPDRPSSWTC